jgi:hypothetical protein
MMVRWSGLLVAIGWIGAGWGSQRDALAKPPRTISDYATVAELETELTNRLAELKPYLADDDSFSENKKRIQQVASMLAVAAQALADHDDESPIKPFAPDIRDAVMKIAQAESLSSANEAMTAAQAALERKSARTSAAEFDWSKLAKQRLLMEDIENRMQQLQRALRRPKDPVKESQLAAAITVANIPTLVDTHEVKDHALLPEWNKLSLQMLDQLKKVTAAIKANEPMEAQAQFKAARATCVECHRQFKKEY